MHFVASYEGDVKIVKDFLAFFSFFPPMRFRALPVSRIFAFVVRNESAPFPGDYFLGKMGVFGYLKERR